MTADGAHGTTSPVIEVDEASFEQDVLERSYEVPVVVDFWAAWCAPCRALGPVLEKLANEAGGDWILAKVDVDANQRIAQSFGIRGIPAVKAFRNGRPVSEFTGALPEPQVRQWLAELGPSKADELAAEAKEAEGREDWTTASDLYREALADTPNHAEARAGLARTEAAEQASSVDVDGLRARLATNPDDVEANAGLASVELHRGDVDAAFGRLLDLVERTSGEHREAAREQLVRLMETLEAGDPRVTAARRRLARALY